MALLIAIPIVVGLAAGVALRLLAPQAVPPFRVRAMPLVLVAAGVEALRAALPDAWVSDPLVARGFGVVDVVLVAVIVLANRPTRATWTVGTAIAVTGAGVAANAAAVVIAGGMPYSRPAALAVGYSPEELAQVPGYLDAATVPDVAAALGDLIPFGALMKVLSIGDLLLFAGVAALLALLVARLLVAPGERTTVTTM